jgi:hypothetical protein
MLIPVLIFLACFGAGVMSSARWLPDLAPGPVGGIAFFVVVGLFSASLGIAGLRIYSIVNEITKPLSGLGLDKAEILAGGIPTLLLDAGTLFGLAGIVYLLAPPVDNEIDEPQSASVSKEA